MGKIILTEHQIYISFVLQEEGPKLNPKEAMVLFKKYNTIKTLIIYGAPGKIFYI